MIQKHEEKNKSVPNSSSTTNQDPGKSISPPAFGLQSGSPLQMKLADNDLVVRGGMSAPENLISNQAKDLRGHISANSAKGVDLDTLATTPAPFPNGSISETTVGEIRNIKNDTGEAMDVLEDPTRNNPVHASIDPHNKALSPNEASALSGAFSQTPNKWKKKKK